MRRFIQKLIIISLPVLLCFILLEGAIRGIPNDYSFKQGYLKDHAFELECLFLGSSHTFYGVNPAFVDKKSFNASHVSQTIDYDFEIFSKYKSDFEKLECLVIPIDYFTFYSRTSTGGERWRIKNYEIYYDIHKSHRLKDHSELLSLKFSLGIGRLIDFYYSGKAAITCSNLGFGIDHREQKDLVKTGFTAAKRHTRLESEFFQENVFILEELVKTAESMGIRVLLYTSPSYYTYVENLDQNQLTETKNKIDVMVRRYENCEYHNFLMDQDFVSSDYNDADHLNEQGAKKLSLKLNEVIRNSK